MDRPSISVATKQTVVLVADNAQAYNIVFVVDVRVVQERYSVTDNVSQRAIKTAEDVVSGVWVVRHARMDSASALMDKNISMVFATITQIRKAVPPMEGPVLWISLATGAGAWKTT